MSAPDDSPPSQTAPAPLPPAPPEPRGDHRGYGKILFEVLMITLGVFLALLVDQWRERSEHQALAEASLQRFRTEFRTNREAVVAVVDKHRASIEQIRTYFTADAAARASMKYPYMATNPAFLQYTAWDLALATQALTYIEPELAQSVAHVYAIQRQLDSATHDITLVMYQRAGDADPVPLTRSLATYFGDCTLIEPRLVKVYDDVLAKLDARLGPVK